MRYIYIHRWKRNIFWWPSNLSSLCKCCNRMWNSYQIKCNRVVVLFFAVSTDFLTPNNCLLDGQTPLPTLPETNSSPLKMDGWNTIVSFWGPAYFQGLWLLVSGRQKTGPPKKTEEKYTVDGRNPAPVDNGKYPIIYDGFHTSQVGFSRISEPSTVFSASTTWVAIWKL